MKRFLKKIFLNPSESDTSPGEVDLDAVLAQVQKAEERVISPGRRIHRLEYGPYEIRLDRDIAGNYRMTVFSGMERVYSFTVYADRGDYETLETAYRSAVEFLDGDQHLVELPDVEFMKGFYYGQG